VSDVPYLKIKCRDCKNRVHRYFREGEEMPKTQKEEYIEYYCDFCKNLWEILE
jgi:phage FluMu protein Com